uniref:Encapsulation-relating protein variant a n=2 Tax=Anoplophora glabripennis TaxID=217634 RepID=A5YRY5_ANOGL|nr:encapsulation-relating protein variant a [Anoplophora glabripennis]
MKCILLLSFVALCYSFPHGYDNTFGNPSGRNININEDGTIVITGANGKRITITKDIGTSGQKNVDISVSGPNMPTKRIQINDQNKLSITGQDEYGSESDESLRDKRSSKDSKKQRGQGDTLTKILAAYQGDVDQTSYQQLLNEVNAAVQAGQLSSSVYDILQNLSQVQGQVGQEGYWGRQQGIIGTQRQASVLDLLREQAIAQKLQQLQQEQQYQQLLQQQQQYQQGVRSPIYVTQGPLGQRSQVLDVPVGTNQQILERVHMWGPQAASYQRGLDVVGQQGIGGIRYISGTGSSVGRTLWQPTVRDLLYGQQVGPIGQSISGKLSEVIEEEREILDQQRQIQLQQLQQEREQQQLLTQQLIQQQQQQEQQRQQQLLQQVQQQQLQQQEELWEMQKQQQQQTNLRDYLLSGGRTNIQTRGQQGLWQQQPSVYSQEGLSGGYGQGSPRIQRYNVPLIL